MLSSMFPAKLDSSDSTSSFLNSKKNIKSTLIKYLTLASQSALALFQFDSALMFLEIKPFQLLTHPECIQSTTYQQPSYT